MSSPQIDILCPIPEDLRAQAGLIYYEAFRRKLQPLVGRPEQTRRVLAAGLNLGQAIGAVVDEELRGVAGLQSPQGVFSRVIWRDSLAHLGLVRGVFAWVVLNLFGSSARCPADQLRIAALAVDGAARGQGIGTRLLEAVFEKARREGFHAVRLEVVDTNLRAKALYERMGFYIIQTHSYPIPPGWLGFSKDHVMVKDIKNSQ